MPEQNVDDNKTPATTPSTPPAPPAPPKADDDLSKKDTSKFTDAQKDDYIAQLKDENARRRIENRDSKSNLEKQHTVLAKLQEDLKSATERVKGFETEKKKASEAEKSEIERLQSRIGEMEGQINQTTTQLREREQQLLNKDRRLKQVDREALVERLVSTLGYNFSSEYERDGFINKMSQLDDNGEFVVSDEKAIYETNQFVTKNKQPPKTPPAGPPGRTNELPLVEEVKTLTALSRKRTLTPEEKKRLDELIAMTAG